MSGEKNNKLPTLNGRPGIMPAPTQEEKINNAGNPDAQILAKAFEEYSKGGLTQAERDRIEKLDDILKGADIVISPSGDLAAIAQDDGKTFTIHSKGPSKGR